MHPVHTARERKASSRGQYTSKWAEPLSTDTQINPGNRNDYLPGLGM